MSSTTYPTWVSEVCANLQYTQILTDPALADPTTSADVNLALSNAIQYGENRIYRELDLIETVTSASVAMTPNVRSIGIPGSLIVPQTAYFITPAGVMPDDPSATRNPLQRVTLDFLNMVCPLGAASVQIPTYWADIDNTTAIIGPAPAGVNRVEFWGTERPAPLSSSNVTTILTTYIPDAFLSATMIYMTGFQRDYGAQSADPQMAMSWEAQYKLQIASAQVEEARKKSMGPAWQPFSPSPIANQPRT